MMAIGLIVAAIVSQQPDPVCELTYVRAPQTRETALRVTSNGVATVELRGEVHQAELGREIAAKLQSRFTRYDLFSLSQREFDRRLATAARQTGLQLPLPHADDCEIQIGLNRLSCRGSSILATRIDTFEELTAFEQLRVDLEQVRSIVILGGTSETARFLSAGGHAIGEPLVLSSLVYADDFAGERVAHFRPTGPHGPLLVVSSSNGELPVARVIELNSP